MSHILGYWPELLGIGLSYWPELPGTNLARFGVSNLVVILLVGMNQNESKWVQNEPYMSPT